MREAKSPHSGYKMLQVGSPRVSTKETNDAGSRVVV